MSLLFDPLYPLHCNYVVSQSIVDLFEIYYWNRLTQLWGKNNAFLYLQYRYERKRRSSEPPVILFMVFIFCVTFVILWFMKWWQRRPIVANPQPVVNQVVDHNHDDQQRQDNPHVEHNTGDQQKVNEEDTNPPNGQRQEQ